MRFLNGPTSLPALLSCDLARKGVEVGPLCKGMLAFPYSLYRKTGANPHRPEEKGGNSTHLPNQGVFWRDSANHNATMQPFAVPKDTQRIKICPSVQMVCAVTICNRTSEDRKWISNNNNNVKISLIVNNLPALHHCTKQYCVVTLMATFRGMLRVNEAFGFCRYLLAHC